MKFSVAIDGPAGAGKSTIAKIIAERFNLMYINTGAMYRAVTLKAIESLINPNDIEELSFLIDTLNMRFDKEKLYVNDLDVSESITTPEVSNKVSEYAMVPQIRKKLVKMQQNMSKSYSVIMDGRDIGTVVLKDAPLKFFITASPEERAKRRYEELKSKGYNVVYEDILNDIIKRDYQDINRNTDPLIKAKDAIEIDTSLLNVNQVVDKISEYIANYKNKLKNKG